MRKVLHKTIQPIHQCLGPSPGESQCDETVSSTIFQILCALDVSRKGLSEEDLINMFSISSNVWSPLYFALEQYLLKKSGLLWYCFFYYCPQTKFAKVMFIHPSVSHSVHRGVCIQGVCILGGWICGVSASRGGLGRPPPSDTTGYGQRAGGTHPTGMHSCFKIF